MCYRKYIRKWFIDQDASVRNTLLVDVEDGIDIAVGKSSKITSKMKQTHFQNSSVLLNLKLLFNSFICCQQFYQYCLDDINIIIFILLYLISVVMLVKHFLHSASFACPLHFCGTKT